MVHLVTGAAGFIGFHLAKYLLERGEQVVGVDALNDYYDPALKISRLAELGITSGADSWGVEIASDRRGGFTFIRVSLEDQEAMEKLFRRWTFDRVCNLAAQAGVRYSLVNPRAYVSSNIVGFLNVLECCRAARTPHLVYASSSSVYGLDPAQPSSTGDRADHPVSMYAATKRADELMAHAYSHLHGLPTTGIRFFTVYGPWGRPDMAYFKFTEAIVQGKPIEVFNNGMMRRDFTFVDDAVEGVVKILDRVPSGPGVPFRLYNIGNASPVPLAEFISTLETILGKKAVRKHLPMQPGDVQSTCADVAELERDLGWKPRTKIHEGLEQFVRWYQAHRTSAPRGD